MALQPAYTVDYDDINGDLYAQNGPGYIEEVEDNLITYFPPEIEDPPGMTFPLDVYLNANTTTAAMRQNVTNWLGKIYAINLKALTVYGHAYAGNPEIARVVAFTRMQLAKSHLCHPDFRPATYHCRYNLCARIPMPTSLYLLENQAAMEAALARAVPAVAPPYTAAQLTTPVGPLNPIFFDSPRPLNHELLKRQLGDLIAIVAYFFRARGHHWQQSYNGRYEKIWTGTTFSRSLTTVGAPWELIARDAFKSVPPIVLDDAWLALVRDGKCSGTFVTRINCAPAGCAVVSACLQGYRDLVTAFPQLTEKFAEVKAYLDEINDDLQEERWCGSINHNYYGVDRVTFDERRLGALAATIRGALEHFDNTNSLLQSPSMTRASTTAPITGAVIARILGMVATSDAMVLAYVPPAERR